MKKGIAVLLAALLLLASAACAETADPLDQISGMVFEFSSGVGAWSTELLPWDHGMFTGNYHDSEMGESAEEYPNGTVYLCSFSGQMSFVEQVDEYSWKLRIDTLTPDPAEETVVDGIRYVPSGSYGLTEGDEMLLFRPGTPVSLLSEEMQFWAHLFDQGNPPAELENWFLMSEQYGSGFVGYVHAASSEP